MSWQEAAIRWYGLLLLMTWGWAPAAVMLCPRLADRGMAIARPLILLGVVYPSWLLGAVGLLPYSTIGLWATVAIGSLAAWTIAIRTHAVDRQWLMGLLRFEIIALVAFGSYLWLRGFTPEILHTEKPMDIAFLSASARATAIPPIDPWFAGEPINYYYLGYLLHGALTRMADVPAAIGFNLALATIFSMVVVAAGGVTFDAVRPWLSRRLAVASGAFAAAGIAIFGNLYPALRLSADWNATVNADWWNTPVGVGWRASRIVCDGLRVNNDCPAPAVETINEFPFFSFLLGDLHPHLMALPMTITVLGLALNLLLRRREEERPLALRDGVTVVITGAAAGSLYVLNSWDLPTYLAIVLICAWVGFGGVSAKVSFAACGLAALSAAVTWLPFIVRFEAPTGGVQLSSSLVERTPLLGLLLTSVGVHHGARTSTGEFLTMFGVPYLAGLVLIASLLAGRQDRLSTLPRASLIAVSLAVVAAIVLDFPLIVLLGVPLLAALRPLWRTPGVTASKIALGCFALAYVLLLIVEVLYIRDAFNSRMNTLFKVYYQVWVLFALGTAIALAVLWQETTRNVVMRTAIVTVAIGAVLTGIAYPIVASRQWTDEFSAWDGLDGSAYLAGMAPAEAAAIAWLNQNAHQDDVVLEVAGCSYQPNGGIPTSRVSAFTGLPTVIGWQNHEKQWRSGQPAEYAAIGQRAVDVATMFAEPTGDLVDRYQVTLLFVGDYEAFGAGPACPIAGPYATVGVENYPGAGWNLAFAQDDVRIYRREIA
ncbi:MAG: hypothetical protein H0W59_01330 [Chloroflexia bacterium]|nr:hypothetical protein [Chloroflexia bacterium]